MAQRFQLPDGRIVEALPQGGYQVVGGNNAVPVTAGNPKLPGEVLGQTLNNQRTMQEIQQAQATATANTAKTKAEALKAEIDARNAQEQYDAQHRPVTKTGLYGPEFLNTLSTSDQAMIKALDEGRLAFPQGSALRAPFWQEKLSQVAQYDPTFDATNYNARAKGRAAAISGKLGTSNNALNTAIGHLGTLYDQIGGTASHGGFPLATTVNSIENWYSKGSGDPGVTNFSDTASKLADELESVYRNGGGAEQGVVRQLRNLDPNMSHDQKIGIVRNAVDLLTSKIAANAAQYNFGTGGKPTWDMLDKDAKATIDRIAPGAVNKYFVAPADSNHAAVGPGFAPPPTGPGSGGPTSGPNDDKPDPQSAAFWEGAARQGMKYTDALSQWQSDAKARGLSTVTPPPPDAYSKAAAYIAAHPNIEYHPFQSITRAKMDPIQAASNAFAQSGTGAFTAHYGNALAFGLPSLAVGQDKAAYIDAVTRAQNPTQSTVGDIAGTVGGMVTAGKGVNAVVDGLKVNPLMARYFRGIGVLPKEGLTGEAADLANMSAGARRALTGDTIYSGVTGAAEDPNDPAGGAVKGMAAMAAGNAAGRYVLGPTLARLGNTKASQALVNALPGKGSFSPPSPLNPGQSTIFGQANNALDSIRGNLTDAQSLGLPYGLADASTKLRLLLGSAARKSPDVRAQAEDVLLPRQAGQAERAIGQINNNLAPVGDVPTIKANAIDSARTAAAPLYDQAYALPGRPNDSIGALLGTPAGKQALTRARTIAANEGRDPNSLGFDLDQQGNTILTKRPSVQTLDYVKRGLDDILETYRNPMTGQLHLDEAGRAINGVRGNLLTEMDKTYPEYGQARSAYAAEAQKGTAAQRGADATSIRVTPEAARTAFDSVGQNAPFFQQGYASNLADIAERSRLTGNPYDAINGSLGQQSKLATVFPQGAPNFMRAQGLEGDMSKTAYEALGGSPTAARAQSDALFNNPGLDAASEAAQVALTGAPSIKMMARLGMKLADLRALGISGAQKKADAIAPILLNTDPSAALAHLDLLQKMALARKAYTTQAGQLGSAVAAPVIYGLTQQ